MMLLHNQTTPVASYYGGPTWAYTVTKNGSNVAPSFVTSPKVVSNYSAWFGPGSTSTSTSYVTYTNNATLASSAWIESAFTFEWWHYATETDGGVIFAATTGPNGPRAALGSGTSTQLLTINAAGNVFNLAPFTFSLNTWYNVAFVRLSSTDFKVYVNGVLRTISTVSPSTIGLFSKLVLDGEAFSPGGNGFEGYLDQMRISTTARYTGGTSVGDVVYTPSTTPFTVDADTWFLSNFENTWTPITN